MGGLISYGLKIFKTTTLGKIANNIEKNALNLLNNDNLYFQKPIEPLFTREVKTIDEDLMHVSRRLESNEERTIKMKELEKLKKN